MTSGGCGGGGPLKANAGMVAGAEAGSSEPCGIWAASADVAHILDNLLENAIRYSPRGTRIEVQLDRNGGRPGFVIADTGPGISQEEQAHARPEAATAT